MNAPVNTAPAVTAHKIEVLAFRHDVNGVGYIRVYANVENKDPATFEDYKTEIASQGYSGLEYMSWEQYVAIEDQENIQRYNVNKPVAIDLALFNDRLNVLSPSRWENTDRYEIFMVPSCITGNIYSFYVRLKGVSNAFYEVNADRRVNYEEMANWCSSAFMA